jgi:Methyltransferase domain
MAPLPPIVSKYVRGAASFVPPLRRAVEEHDRLVAERDRRDRIFQQAEELQARAPQFVPPGHFYSPIPILDDVRRDDARLFAPLRELPGIDLDEAGQLELLSRLLPYYRDLDFPEQKEARRRFWFENPAYSYSDAIFLHCMIRYCKPKRFIEVGSGFSSCMTLDTNEQHFGNRIDCAFIEPYPELLRSLLRPEDHQRIEIVSTRVQDVGLRRFSALEAGDILFIDSTHVTKAGSDVNYLYFEVLPVLKPGVFVHIHDIFVSFQYPRPWVLEGRQWTEGYLLRAFLMYNKSFRIRLFNTFLETFHEEWFAREMPLCLRNTGGSIWLERTD